MADLNDFGKTVQDTAPEKLRDLPTDALEACYAYFVDLLPQVLSRQAQFHIVSGRINLLRDEIQARARAKADADREQKSKDRHEENRTLGRWTLFWAAVAAIGTVGLLILDIPFSKLLPSTSSQASPTSSPQAAASAAPSATPTAVESPSATPQASSTPELVATPE